VEPGGILEASSITDSNQIVANPRPNSQRTRPFHVKKWTLASHWILPGDRVTSQPASFSQTCQCFPSDATSVYLAAVHCSDFASIGVSLWIIL
jgi:hypothetical protein